MYDFPLESMLISRSEVYTYSHDPKRGVTLGFLKARGVIYDVICVLVLLCIWNQDRRNDFVC
jgi:hypothetical protein